MAPSSAQLSSPAFAIHNKRPDSQSWKSLREDLKSVGIKDDEKILVCVCVCNR